MNFRINPLLAPLTIVIGSLVRFPLPAMAQTTSLTNPCPRIYYEEPYNQRLILPASCPPNAATKAQSQQSQLPTLSPNAMPANTTPVNTMPQLLPGVEPTPIATVSLQSGRVNVQLKNTVNTPVTYQAIGHTEERILAPRSEVTLQDLPAPVTITFLRSDSGLLKVAPMVNAEPGNLMLMLNEATGLNDSQGSVRIQATGKVLAY
jgi:hypothetical protein